MLGKTLFLMVTCSFNHRGDKLLVYGFKDLFQAKIAPDDKQALLSRLSNQLGIATPDQNPVEHKIMNNHMLQRIYLEAAAPEVNPPFLILAPGVIYEEDAIRQFYNQYPTARFVIKNDVLSSQRNVYLRDEDATNFFNKLKSHVRVLGLTNLFSLEVCCTATTTFNFTEQPELEPEKIMRLAVAVVYNGELQLTRLEPIHYDTHEIRSGQYHFGTYKSRVNYINGTVDDEWGFRVTGCRALPLLPQINAGLTTLFTPLLHQINTHFNATQRVLRQPRFSSRFGNHPLALKMLETGWDI